jgi:hypothetical protein
MALVRGGWQGSLPLKFSKDGFEWVEQVSASTEQAIDALQRQVDSLEHDLEDMSRLVVRRFEGGGRSG